MVDLARVKITGGPHAMNTIVMVDGQKLAGITAVEVALDVHDAPRITTHSFAEVTVDVEGVVTTLFDVRVNVKEELGWAVAATSRAETIWEGLYDCARQLELAARRNGHGVAQAGTVVGSSGRPPGH